MADGFAGKILLVDLTNRTFGTLDTEQYSDKWLGAHGIGSKIHWDRAPREMIDGLDPSNVVTIMAGPLSGTLSPTSGRTEIQGNGPSLYPTHFSRTGHGGRVSGQLKAAGWDGVVLEGVASSPVWLNIVNDQVTLEDATDLWGMDVFLAEEEIWRRVSGYQHRFGEWLKLPGTSYTTQRPAVEVIGPAGEAAGGRIGCIVHDKGHGAGTGGFGSAWGAKNLKAISALGTGGFPIADPEELVALRGRYMSHPLMNIDVEYPENSIFSRSRGSASLEPNRPTGCEGCPKPCYSSHYSGMYNAMRCSQGSWYTSFYSKDEVFYSKGSPDYIDPWTAVVPLTLQDAPTTPDVKYSSTNTMQGQGLDSRQMRESMNTLRAYYEQGIAGPGDGFLVNTDPLPMEKHGTLEFAEKICEIAADQTPGLGAALAQGTQRMSQIYGLMEADLESGRIHLPMWGAEFHHYLPNIEWAYSTLVGDRDINEHIHSRGPSNSTSQEARPAEFMVQRNADLMIPFEGDLMMFDYTWQGRDGSQMEQALDTGIYSRHKAVLTAWSRHYTRAYIQSGPFCCLGGSYAVTAGQGPEFRDVISEQPKYLNAVTGRNTDFAGYMELGRRIWNLDRAIWILSGRHRDQEKFAGYFYKPFQNFQRKQMTIYNRATGGWEYPDLNDMSLTHEGVEAWKDHYYAFEGWDTDTGWPSRATLEDLDMGDVADVLQAANKLGATGTYMT